MQGQDASGEGDAEGLRWQWAVLTAKEGANMGGSVTAQVRLLQYTLPLCQISGETRSYSAFAVQQSCRQGPVRHPQMRLLRRCKSQLESILTRTVMQGAAGMRSKTAPPQPAPIDKPKGAAADGGKQVNF